MSAAEGGRWAGWGGTAGGEVVVVESVVLVAALEKSHSVPKGEGGRA